MLNKFLKEIVSSISGRNSEGIIDILDGKKYISEFLIAKKLNLTINQTRNILYKISDHGLVSYIRKKDKKKGWYTYFWKLEILKCLEFFKENLIKRIDQINHQIKSRETKGFYVCEVCGIEFTEENALIHNFMCNECGEIMSRKDNAPVIKEYNHQIDRLKRDLASIEEEINLEMSKIEKSRARELKKAEQIKKKEKEAAKAKRSLCKKAVSKKTPSKKSAKKAPVKKTKKQIKKSSKKK